MKLKVCWPFGGLLAICFLLGGPVVALAATIDLSGLSLYSYDDGPHAGAPAAALARPGG